ncbi:acid phosphatase (class A) [Rhizomicrobium palustre]|uniref:Acid phosphatase n=1 Tax=Rhizomicrobium palustre TaxID=189966 RepID=A0A846N127_9PROT|nr:phosphatase PAP2 family protein [Rhizomicrobium palustre]NIK89664.1 acid phosphatase (class A) [Rhizomicrobium palustre]
MTKTAIAFLAAAIVLSGGASAKDAKAQREGYLKPGVVDIMSILPPAPVVGDPRYETDRAIFKATRRYIGTPRWSMATNDARYDDVSMLADFSCALGASLDPASVPHLMALMRKVGTDTQRETNVAKNINKRLRPYKIDDGEICQPKEELGDSYDYPSGHTTGGWTWALVLSDVVPDRASQIMARGRAYGESRIVCGAHNASAVEGGRLSATTTLTVVRNTKAYQDDVATARAEFAAVKKAAPAMCQAEQALIKENIFVPAP